MSRSANALFVKEAKWCCGGKIRLTHPGTCWNAKRLRSGGEGATPQAERAGPRWAKGLRMDAQRAKTWRSQGLVHDSRTPTGGGPKTGIPRIAVKLCTEKAPNASRIRLGIISSLCLESSATGCQ